MYLLARLSPGCGDRLAFVMNEPQDFEVFWAEMTPCEHFVQIYQEDTALLDALEGFIAGGLRNDESAIVIATPTHRRNLAERLQRQGIDLPRAEAEDRYITLDAEQSLLLFMRNGWPEENYFQEFIHGLLERTQGRGRRVRAFGEMVALLWAQGHNGATVRLEHLWHALCRTESFSLFCAYPKSGFTQDATTSLQEICDAHSKVLGTTH
jgi:hypothetical protein